jgi:hypothetical protein
VNRRCLDRRAFAGYTPQKAVTGFSLFSVDFCRQDNRWKQRRVRSRPLLGNSRYTVTPIEAQALTHFRAVTLAVTLRYIPLHFGMCLNTFQPSAARLSSPKSFSLQPFLGLAHQVRKPALRKANSTENSEEPALHSQPID